jgi:glycosyltransferase involved in cell wall biosynthesis
LAIVGRPPERVNETIETIARAFCYCAPRWRDRGAAANMGAAFTIVIPTREAGPHLERLLRALTRLERPEGGFEVVIADDGSTERLDQRVAPFIGELEIRVLAERGYSGAPRCRELGWRAASGEVIAFLDPDMIVGPGWLVAHARALAGGADVVSGARWSVDGPAAETETAAELRARARPGLHGGAVAGPIFGAIERELERWCRRAPQGVLVAFGAQAANLAVRRRVLERTTGFNTCLRRFGDVELGIRLWELGARFACSADAYAVRCARDDADRGWFDDDGAQAMFWRHPYGDLLRLHVWARRRQAAGAGAAEAGVAASADADAASAGLAWLDQPWDTAELHRELGAHGPGLHNWTEDDLLEHFEKVDGLRPADVRADLDRGVARGFYHEVRGGTRYFRVDRTDFWMRDTTAFTQRIYLNDLAQALYQPDPDLAHPTVLAASAQVRVSLDREALHAAGVDHLNIALPVERCGQHAVEIHAASTPALLEAARNGRGMLAQFPLADAMGRDGCLALDFSFRLPSPLTRSHDEARPASLLQTTLPPGFRARAERVLREVGVRPDPFETAGALYEWIQDNVLFGVMPPQFPYYRVLEFGVGNCIQQTRVYVALCRLAGIPAREACGVLLHAGGEEKPQVTKEVKARGYGPFAHTWADLQIPDRGWVPVEFHGFGRQGFTPVAMPDLELRKEVERVLYRRYPFGTLHPFRIVTGPQANRLPLLRLPDDVDPDAAQRALEATFHRVTCTFTRQAPAATSP